MERRLKNQGNRCRELPQETLEDVLVRLPVKSLVRFKCVSKPWLSLITSPQFVQWHLRYHRDGNSSNKLQSSVLLSNGLSIGGGNREDGFREAVLLDCPLHHKYVQGVTVVGCCDGMLCLVVGFFDIFLWNPSTKESRKLPLPPYNQFVHPGIEVFGFGYDSLTNDYKLVRLPSLKCRQHLKYDQSCVLQVNVFTLKTNSWTRIQDITYYLDHIDQPIGSNGSLYWWVSTRTDFVLHFDLAEETFREVALPPLHEFGENNPTMGIWGGSLCLLRDYMLWVLGEGGAWTKLMTLPKIPQLNYSPSLDPLCFTNTGKVFIAVGAKNFVLYDPKERTYEKLDICGIVDNWYNMTVYTESLISPGTGIVAEVQG